MSFLTGSATWKEKKMARKARNSFTSAMGVFGDLFLIWAICILFAWGCSRDCETLTYVECAGGVVADLEKSFEDLKREFKNGYEKIKNKD